MYAKWPIYSKLVICPTLMQLLKAITKRWLAINIKVWKRSCPGHPRSSPRLNNATKKDIKYKIMNVEMNLRQFDLPEPSIFQRNTIYHREKQVNWKMFVQMSSNSQSSLKMYHYFISRIWSRIISRILFRIGNLMWYRQCYNIYSFLASLLKRLRFL